MRERPKLKSKQYLETRFKEHFGDGRQKGLENVSRAFMVAQTMVEEEIIMDVRRASKKQNSIRGIDMWVYPLSDDGFRVPLQIKSSAKRAEDSRLKRENPYEVAIVVITESLSDEEVKERIMANVRIWISKNFGRAGMAEVVNAPV